ncbi:MAG: site-specific integrase, partial [Deltaproteobacteria bacterium]|nr:site-specific integrase [Deltaproteobacteria bacterium]
EQYRRSTETGNKKLAIRIFDKLKGDIVKGKWLDVLPGETYTFGNLMERYLEEYSSVNKAKTSYTRDKSLTAHLLKPFKDEYLVDITPAMISDYKVQRRREGAAPRTINYELTLMSHAFNIGILEWEWVNDNPVKKVKKERVNNAIERWLTREEEKRLLGVSAQWLQEIIVFAIHTGLRQSEILDLKWPQVDMTRRTILIYEQKNRGVDTLPLNETALGVLEERQRHHLSQCDNVFHSNNQTRIVNRNLCRAFKIATEKARVNNFRFHDLRHTFATRLVQSGVGIYEVQRLGRWKSTSMVMRYAHHNSESLRASIEVMDGFRATPITNLSQSPKKRGHKPLLRLVTPCN